MPNDYGPAMRIFTKMSKVPFGHLRSQGRNSAVYVADSYLQGDTFSEYFSPVVNRRFLTKVVK